MTSTVLLRFLRKKWTQSDCLSHIDLKISLSHKPRFSKLESGQFSPPSQPVYFCSAALKEAGEFINSEYFVGTRVPRLVTASAKARITPRGLRTVSFILLLCSHFGLVAQSAAISQGPVHNEFGGCHHVRPFSIEIIDIAGTRQEE
jgi:hypothetical protein